MNNTDTARVHVYTDAGCKYQWTRDHDDAHCIKTFKAHQEADTHRAAA